MQGPGFITVKHGANEETIFNTWCPCHMLLKYVVRKCLTEEEKEKVKNMKFDLIDTNGKLRQLQENPYLYANHVMDPREIYILVKIEPQDDEETRYVSQLHDIGRLYPKVKAKLDELSQYKVSGKVGARWAKIKTVSKFSSLAKQSARGDKSDRSLDRKESMNSLDRMNSARSERSNKSSKKTQGKDAGTSAAKRNNQKAKKTS